MVGEDSEACSKVTVPLTEASPRRTATLGGEEKALVQIEELSKWEQKQERQGKGRKGTEENGMERNEAGREEKRREERIEREGRDWLSCSIVVL